MMPEEDLKKILARYFDSLTGGSYAGQSSRKNGTNGMRRKHLVRSHK